MSRKVASARALIDVKCRENSISQKKLVSLCLQKLESRFF